MQKRTGRCKSMWLTESDVDQIEYLKKTWKLENETLVIKRCINQSVAIEKSLLINKIK